MDELSEWLLNFTSSNELSSGIGYDDIVTGSFPDPVELWDPPNSPDAALGCAQNAPFSPSSTTSSLLAPSPTTTLFDGIETMPSLMSDEDWGNISRWIDEYWNTVKPPTPPMEELASHQQTNKLPIREAPQEYEPEFLPRTCMELWDDGQNTNEFESTNKWKVSEDNLPLHCEDGVNLLPQSLSTPPSASVSRLNVPSPTGPVTHETEQAGHRKFRRVLEYDEYKDILAKTSKRDRSYKCPVCSRSDQEGRKWRGDYQHFKQHLFRHIKTAERPTSPIYLCNGISLQEAESRSKEVSVWTRKFQTENGEMRVFGCGCTFTRKDSLVRHVRGSQGSCLMSVWGAYRGALE